MPEAVPSQLAFPPSTEVVGACIRSFKLRVHDTSVTNTYRIREKWKLGRAISMRRQTLSCRIRLDELHASV